MILVKTVDVLISFDMTGSMRPCVHQVRVEIHRFIANIVSDLGDVRVAIITHGDYDSSRYLTRHMDFTDDIERMRTYIMEVEDSGTNIFNDGEAYEEVLHLATTLDWRVNSDGELPLTRILIMIGDDIPHPKGFRYRDQEAKYDWKEELNCLKAMGVITYGIQAPTLSERRSHDFYSEISVTGEPIKLHQFSNIVDTITAIVFSPQGPDALIELEEQLISNNRYNRNMEQVFNNLLDREDQARYITTSVTDSTLEEVHPARFQVLSVVNTGPIKAFVLATGIEFKAGRGFYELTKTESITRKKEIILQHITNGNFYTGVKAREMIGLEPTVTKRVHPRDVPSGYKAFVKSTSYNRKLIEGTHFLYDMVI